MVENKKIINFGESSKHMWAMIYFLRKFISEESCRSINGTKIWTDLYFPEYWRRE